jgi:hypothetical protein
LALIIHKSIDMSFNEKEVLERLDMAHKGIPAPDYPDGHKEDIKYNFFLDLEHGYCETAGNRIHLYGDSSRWAIVFEKNGYQNRGGAAEIELNYVGNCVDYPVSGYPERNYISNSNNITLISGEEYDRISNKEGIEMELFELIGAEVTHINIRSESVEIEQDAAKYENAGIEVRDYDNPKSLIGFGDVVRYLNETNPLAITATEEEIKRHIPTDLPKLMTINEFHFISYYDDILPSLQETFQLIAKILTTGDSGYWKPALNANNHWSNWESGNL